MRVRLALAAAPADAAALALGTAGALVSGDIAWSWGFPLGNEIRRRGVVARSAEGGPHLVAAGAPTDERRRPRRPRVGPIGTVRKADAPAGKRVEVGGQAPVTEIPHSVRPHRSDRRAGLVNDLEPQTGDRQGALEEIERGATAALRSRDGAPADAEDSGQLPLAEVGTSARPPQRAGHVEISIHAATLSACQSPSEAVGSNLWTEDPSVDRGLQWRRMCAPGSYVSASPRDAET